MESVLCIEWKTKKVLTGVGRFSSLLLVDGIRDGALESLDIRQTSCDVQNAVSGGKRKLRYRESNPGLLGESEP